MRSGVQPTDVVHRCNILHSHAHIRLQLYQELGSFWYFFVFFYFFWFCAVSGNLEAPPHHLLPFGSRQTTPGLPDDHF